jgi:hypothetical protein
MKENAVSTHANSLGIKCLFLPYLGDLYKPEEAGEVKHLIDREPLHQDLGRSGVLVKNYFFHDKGAR